MEMEGGTEVPLKNPKKKERDQRETLQGLMTLLRCFSKAGAVIKLRAHTERNHVHLKLYCLVDLRLITFLR